MCHLHKLLLVFALPQGYSAIVSTARETRPAHIPLYSQNHLRKFNCVQLLDLWLFENLTRGVKDVPHRQPPHNYLVVARGWDQQMKRAAMQRRPRKVLKRACVPGEKIAAILHKCPFFLIALQLVKLNQTNLACFRLIDFFTPCCYHYWLVESRSPFETPVTYNSISSHLNWTQSPLKVKLICTVFFLVVNLV